MRLPLKARGTVVTVSMIRDRLVRQPEEPLSPLPPGTVLARCPRTCEEYGLTRREREDDRELADKIGVPHYDSRIGT